MLIESCATDWHIFRFDPDSKAVLEWTEEASADKARKKPKKSTTPKRQPVPRPRVPRPPSFKQPQRNLREEPMPRIRKHTDCFPEDHEDPGQSM